MKISNCVMIKFGVVQAVRMLDEGIVQSSLYCDNEIQKYKETGFQNVIYEIQDGGFVKCIKQISDAPFGAGEKNKWDEYIKNGDDLIEMDDRILAYELINMRYCNQIQVHKVEFTEKYLCIVLDDDKMLSIAYYSDSDYSWILEEDNSLDIYPEKYCHFFEQKPDTGLKLEPLQKYVSIPLDIFVKCQQNKDISGKRDAWLTLLACDEPERIMALIEKYPEFRQIYEEGYEICRNTERVI